MNLKRQVRVSFLLFLLALNMLIYISSAASTAISVNPADSYANVGAAFSVDIYITDVSNLTSWQFVLYFDNSLVNCTGVSEGQFLNSVGGTFFNENVTNNFNGTHGRVLAYCSLYGDNSASGNGVLATVYFQALASGDSSLYLSNTKLYDASMPPNPIDHTDIGGSVHVQNFLLTISTVGQGYVTRNDTGPYYDYGDAVLLTAFPAIGWSFNNWSGNLIGTANPATLVIVGNMSVIATFTQNAYTLSVFVSGSGSVNLNNTGPYQYGDVVLLTAIPSTGWSFDHWSGDLTGSVNPETLTITGNMGANATFVQTSYTVTTSISPPDVGYVTLIGPGPYHYGDNVQAWAIGKSGWTFDHWSGNLTGTVNPATLTIVGNMSVTATFTQNAYTLTTSTVGQGYITRNNTAQYYKYGDAILLTAVPFVGWSFDHWSGNLGHNSNPATLVIVGNMSVTAHFTQNAYTLTVTISPEESGTVSLNGTGSYNYGDAALLIAVPSAHWSFDHWSGSLSGSANPATLVMTSNMSVTATFAPVNYTLNVSVAGGGSVIKNNTGPYHYGDAVKLNATSSVGWTFDHWSGDLSGSANPATLTITGNMSVTANFVKCVYYIMVTTLGQGNVTLNNTGPYYYGDAVQLTGVPSVGWSFQRWTYESYSPTNQTIVLVITHTLLITASFIRNVYVLTVSTVGNGSVALNNTGPNYYYGDVVQLNATPGAGWVFRYWSGDLNGLASSATLVMTANFSVAAHFLQKPSLSMSPTGKICRIYGENFATTVNIFDAASAEGFMFEIHYNTTLIHYVGVTWDAWGIGTITVDEATGNITGFTSGAPLSGTQTLVTITFQASFYHVWKSAANWTNDLTGTIFLQWANLSYSIGSDLGYVRGGLNQITVGPDFVYTFSPILGDVNNNGTVDIFDLRAVAAYFDAKKGDPNWTEASTYDLNGDGVIGTSDLAIVASNFEYTYLP